MSKFVKFHDNRTKRNFLVNSAFVTCIADEECKAWGRAEITVIGNAGYHTFCIHVDETPEQAWRMLTT